MRHTRQISGCSTTGLQAFAATSGLGAPAKMRPKGSLREGNACLYTPKTGSLPVFGVIAMAAPAAYVVDRGLTVITVAGTILPGVPVNAQPASVLGSQPGRFGLTCCESDGVEVELSVVGILM